MRNYILEKQKAKNMECDKMYNLILACVGLAIAIAGGVYLCRLLYLKKYGVATKAEVIGVREAPPRKGKPSGAYIHTMRYSVSGKSYEEDDKAGYSEPMKEGSTHIILCDPKDPKRFKFEKDLQSHITIAAVFSAMALVFAARFLYEYMK